MSYSINLVSGIKFSGWFIIVCWDDECVSSVLWDVSQLRMVCDSFFQMATVTPERLFQMFSKEELDAVIKDLWSWHLSSFSCHDVILLLIISCPTMLKVQRSVLSTDGQREGRKWRLTQPLTMHSYKGKTACLILCSVDYLSERSNAWISHWTYKGIG